MFHGTIRMYDSADKSRDKYCTGYTDEGQDKAWLTNYIWQFAVYIHMYSKLS